MRYLFALILTCSLCTPSVLRAEDAATQTQAKPAGIIERLRGSAVQSSETAPATHTKLNDFKPAEDQPSMAGLVFKIVQALGICLGMLMVGVYAFKRYAPGIAQSASRRLKVKERLALTSKTSLLLVELDGRSVLITVGTERVAFSENDFPFKLSEQDEKEFGLICNEAMGSKLPA